MQHGPARPHSGTLAMSDWDSAARLQRTVLVPEAARGPLDRYTESSGKEIEHGQDSDQSQAGGESKPGVRHEAREGKWNSRKMPTVTPHLVVAGAAKAIEFYKKAFGAEEMMRLEGPDG